MARLTSSQRHALPSSDFALPGRRYPIENASHARNALSRVSQYGTPGQKAAVRGKVAAKYPTIGKRNPAMPGMHQRTRKTLASHLMAMRHQGSFGKPSPGPQTYGAGVD